MTAADTERELSRFYPNWRSMTCIRGEAVWDYECTFTSPSGERITIGVNVDGKRVTDHTAP